LASISAFFVPPIDVKIVSSDALEAKVSEAVSVLAQHATQIEKDE
jgi:hypothetical protein